MKAQRIELMMEVLCLLATDDESCTYNRRVNYLSPIGEHHMMVKALTHGVGEEWMAGALDVDIGTIRRKRNLLNGATARREFATDTCTPTQQYQNAAMTVYDALNEARERIEQ